VSALPSLPGIPGLPRAIELARHQAKAIAGVPRTLFELNRSVLGLIEAINAARETLAAAGVVVARMERMSQELEEPILALRPGLERLARILDDDVVDTIPEVLKTINEDVLPLLQGLRDTQSRVNSLATVLPGASLLFSRRPARPVAGEATVIVPAPDEN
jgi:signal transduction histidine kinase